MSADPNKKSARTFQCRDVLWETFEQMARELECSIDYLINESMKQYARQRSYSPRTPFPGNARDGQSPGSGQSLAAQGRVAALAWRGAAASFLMRISLLKRGREGAIAELWGAAVKKQENEILDFAAATSKGAKEG